MDAWEPKASTLPGRLEELYINLYERDILTLGDVHVVQEWLQGLSDIGYKFPAIVA
jgi:hypothetical protein